MRVLLDTNAFLRAAVEPDRLGPARSIVADPANQRLVSAASAWEIAVKAATGRLRLPAPVEVFVPESIDRLVATPIPVEHAEVVRVASLPLHHRDPFDRLLVVQAQALRVPLVTADHALAAYDVDLLLTTP